MYWQKWSDKLSGIMHAFDQGVHRQHDQRPEALERQIEELGPVERA